jgi:hypothetical protein
MRRLPIRNRIRRSRFFLLLMRRKKTTWLRNRRRRFVESSLCLLACFLSQRLMIDFVFIVSLDDSMQIASEEGWIRQRRRTDSCGIRHSRERCPISSAPVEISYMKCMKSLRRWCFRGLPTCLWLCSPLSGKSHHPLNKLGVGLAGRMTL